MKPRVSDAGLPGRAEATQGVEQRLAATLHAYPGLVLDPIPAQFLRPGAFPGVHGPMPGGRRVLRGGHLRDLGGDAAGEAYDLIRELWESSGCPVDDVTGLDGRMLTVHDPAGYLVTVTRQGEDDPILTVASPPIASRLVERELLAGLLSGLAIGCVGPCVSGVAPMAVLPSMAGVKAAYWAWVPLFLLVTGVTLGRPETRRFGAGLLAGGVLVGFTVAGFVSSS